ncbi:MAG: AIR synthase-related protein [Candidatus Bathycorpusculaceae bacterium]
MDSLQDNKQGHRIDKEETVGYVFKMGKLTTGDLKKLLKCIGKDSRVIVPPMPGFDSGVHFINGKYLVVSTDPCIGVPQKWFGWLLIHYAASDVAVFGAKPEFCTINLLGPPSTKPEKFYEVMEQACKAADELEMVVVTGHTGTYEGLLTLVGVCTAYGIADKEKLITPGGAKPGDHILCTKSIGLEVAVNFALTHAPLAEKLFGTARAKRLSELIYMQSCVKEALLLSEIKGTHAMHDATEGGLTAALNEMAEASRVGFKIELEKIPINEEAQILSRCFNIPDEQTLSMSSTGTILAAVSPDEKGRIEGELRGKGIEASFLGVFTKDKRRILIKNGKEVSFPQRAEDSYEKIMTGKLQRL